MSGLGPEVFGESAGDRRNSDLVAGASGRTSSRSSNAELDADADADAGRRVPVPDGFGLTADGCAAGPPTSKIPLQAAQRMRAAGALSGMEPLDPHDGQITILDKRPSCGDSTVSNDWLDEQNAARDERSVPHRTDHSDGFFFIRAFPPMRFKH